MGSLLRVKRISTNLEQDTVRTQEKFIKSGYPKHYKQYHTLVQRSHIATRAAHSNKLQCLKSDGELQLKFLTANATKEPFLTSLTN